MRSFSDAARKRVGYKARLENWIERLKNAVMQHAVAHRGFVYMSALRIGDEEAGIGAMLVSFVTQIAVQLKNMLLNFLLEIHYVYFISLIAFEYVPRRKQMLGRGHVLKYSFIRFHI